MPNVVITRSSPKLNFVKGKLINQRGSPPVKDHRCRAFSEVQVDFFQVSHRYTIAGGESSTGLVSGSGRHSRS